MGPLSGRSIRVGELVNWKRCCDDIERADERTLKTTRH